MTDMSFSLVGMRRGRDEATRTPDPYVPNVVRYQLRYIPKPFTGDSFEIACKGSTFK